MLRRTTTVRRRLGLLTLAIASLGLVIGDGLGGAQPRPPAPALPTPYGSAIGADSLANTQIGGTSCGCPNLTSSFRFRVKGSARLTNIRMYLIIDREGYSGGTGGSVAVSIREDDGSASHRPVADAMTTATVPMDPFPLVSFGEPPALVGGRLYHIVFRNTDPSPTANFVSLNSLYTSEPANPRQPGRSNVDWGQLLDYGDGWVERPEYTPILELRFDDGTVDGVGYMESWVAAPKLINGRSRVRETIVVRGGDLTASTVSVRLARIAGSAPLRVRLETTVRSPVSEGSVAGRAIALGGTSAETGSSWVTFDLSPTAYLLELGTYYVTLETEPGTTYRLHGLRKGESVGFDPRTYFADGYAEVDDGSGWVPFDPGWRGPLREADLQFYLR